jgi:hypothetical protein
MWANLAGYSKTRSTTAACSALPGAEVAGGGFDGGVAEKCLDLGGVGAALAAQVSDIHWFSGQGYLNTPPR